MMRSRGMTLIEIIIVLSVLGVFGAIGTPLYFGWLADTQVQEAAVRFARDVDGARLLAKRTGVARTVAATAGASSYTLGGSTIELGPQVAFAGNGTTSTTFAPPYGTKETAVDTYRIVHRRLAAATRTIRIVGVTGEAVIRRD